jgi:DNA-binding FadR family transcriptional regulator
MTDTPPRRPKNSRSHAVVGGAGRIAEELGTSIVAGVYRPNELVPGELELGRRFGASRSVVREAFKLLSAKGLISSRKRS